MFSVRIVFLLVEPVTLQEVAWLDEQKKLEQMLHFEMKNGVWDACMWKTKNVSYQLA